MDDTTLQKMIFTPQPLAPEMQEELGQFFSIVEISPKLVKNFYQQMYSFFGTEPATLQAKMKMYSGSYWDWYVRSTWKLYLTLSADDLVFHIKTQLATAFRLSIPIEQLLFHYLFRIVIEDQPIQSLFSNIQTAMLQNSFPINPLSAKTMTYMELSKKVLAVPVDETASLQLASLYGEIEMQLYGTNKTLSPQEKADNTRAFIDFVRFLTDKESDILKVIDTYVYEILRDKEEEEEIDEVIPQVQAVVNKSEIPPAEEILTLDSIKQMVDNQFEKDEVGQYKDIEGVFGLLEQLAEEYNDEKIKELLYFDEQSGGFVWMNE